MSRSMKPERAKQKEREKKKLSFTDKIKTGKNVLKTIKK